MPGAIRFPACHSGGYFSTDPQLWILIIGVVVAIVVIIIIIIIVIICVTTSGDKSMTAREALRTLPRLLN